MSNFLRKLAAEFVGTFGVVFIAAAAICADQYLAATSQGRLGPLGLALAYGLAYAVMASALGHISGGHFDPAVTIGYWVTRRIGTIQAACYWIAQLLGSMAAAYLLVSIIPDASWRTRALGSLTPDLSPDITRGQAMALEAVATFLFVIVLFATSADGKRALQKFSGIASGMALAMGALVAAPFTGGSMNPARTFGPALITHHWENHGVYWVGPLLGGALAAILYDRIFLRSQPQATPNAPWSGESARAAEENHHTALRP